MLDVRPVVLNGEYVRLEPLAAQHAEALWEAARYEEIWTWMTVVIRTREDMNVWLERALAARDAGTELPFAVVAQDSGRVIGSTRFLQISPKDRGLEIGWTWLTPSVWKTPVNTECKFLLLRHCFEELGCIRVQLKTESRNLNSQRAIERIGGVREGVLRNHMIVRGGVIRDTVMYSILDREWPQVKARLLTLMDRKG